MGTVLLTGAGGFVVGHLAAALAAVGERVVLLDERFDAGVVERWRDCNARFVRCPAGALGAHVDEPVDAVVHGAALTASPVELGWTPEAYLEHELGQASTVWRWAAEHDVRRCVFVSSAGVFAGDEAPLLDERVEPRPDSHYGLAKRLIEGAIEGLRRLDGRDVCSVRLGDVFGTGERSRPSRPRTSLLRRMLDSATRDGLVPARVPSRSRAWSYAPDVGEALQRLLAAPRLEHGLYHVSTLERHDERSLAEAVAALVPGARAVEVPAEPGHADDCVAPASGSDEGRGSPVGNARRAGRFVAERFARAFPDHVWTPLAAALPALLDAATQVSTQAAAKASSQAAAQDPATIGATP